MKSINLRSLGKLATLILLPISITACQTVVDENGAPHQIIADGDVFKGTMTQSDGQSFPMEIKGVKPTRVEYPTLGCSGELVPVARNLNEVVFRESIDRGSCIDGGTFKSTMSGRNVINLKWSKEGSSLTAIAALYRNGKNNALQSNEGVSGVVGTSENLTPLSTFDFDQISKDPAKYILAKTIVNGKPSNPYDNTCDSWYCLTKGTSQEVHLPFEIQISLKQPYRDEIIAAGRKIQVKIAPDFVAESIKNGKKITQKGSYLFADGDVFNGSIFKSYELSPENGYSITVQHKARIPILVKFDNGTTEETHDVKGTVTGITRAKEGKRYDTSYGN